MYNIFPLDIVLTNSQKEVLESEPNVIIYGPAGSGKTFLTVLLAEKLKKLNPTAKIEVIVFTKALRKFISEALMARKIVDVIVSHSYGTHKEVDYIILDEFQDFEINTILKIKDRVNVGMYLLGDLNQQIYSFLNNNKKLDESVNSLLGFKEIRLMETIRFNYNVYNFINDFFPLEATNINNQNNEIKPEIYPCDNQDSQKSKIIELIKLNIKNGDIGVLVEDNYTVSELVKYFKPYKIIDGYKINDDMKLNFGKSKTNILTYHSAKGLEFDTVILPFLEYHKDKHNSDFYYTGFSRAKKNIHILYSYDFPPLFEKINSGLYDGELIRKPFFEDAILRLECYKSLYDECKGKSYLIPFLNKEKLEMINEIKTDLINQKSNLSEVEIEKWITNEISKKEKGF